MIIIKCAQTKQELARVKSYAGWHRAQKYKYATVANNANIYYVKRAGVAA